jgi:type IV pilus assembly protein PilY1
MMKHIKIPKRQLLATAVACAYMSVVVLPVYASDTEIYVDSSQNTAIAPNLMMMFDTSGSMDDCVDSNDSCDSNTSNKRINVLKTAMRQILRGDAASGVSPIPGFVKMGLSRYHTSSSNGGYVMYPVRPLDAFAAMSPTGILTNTIPSNDSDAIQKFADAGAGTDTGGALKIGWDSSNNYLAALRFSDVRVPKGATITSAYLELTPNANGVASSTWEIVAEATGNAAVYGQINDRTYGDIFSYSPDVWVSGEPKQIPVTAAINEVVNRSDWCGGNALAVRIRDVGTVKALRSAYSSNTAPNEAVSRV